MEFYEGERSGERELMKAFRDLPPEVLNTLVELVRTLKRGLEAEMAHVQAEKVVKRYKEKAAGFHFGLVPDADYAEELMEVYRETFPRAPVEN